ncbi:hypothetical protein [Liquorilactobacillus hordei]
MLEYIHDQDEIVVLSLDRLGMSSHVLTEIIEEVRHKGGPY